MANVWQVERLPPGLHPQVQTKDVFRVASVNRGIERGSGGGEKRSGEIETKKERKG